MSGALPDHQFANAPALPPKLTASLDKVKQFCNHKGSLVELTQPVALPQNAPNTPVSSFVPSKSAAIASYNRAADT